MGNIPFFKTNDWKRPIVLADQNKIADRGKYVCSICRGDLIEVKHKKDTFWGCGKCKQLYHPAHDTIRHSSKGQKVTSILGGITKIEGDKLEKFVFVDVNKSIKADSILEGATELEEDERIPQSIRSYAKQLGPAAKLTHYSDDKLDVISG